MTQIFKINKTNWADTLNFDTGLLGYWAIGLFDLMLMADSDSGFLGNLNNRKYTWKSFMIQPGYVH